MTAITHRWPPCYIRPVPFQVIGFRFHVTTATRNLKRGTVWSHDTALKDLKFVAIQIGDPGHRVAGLDEHKLRLHLQAELLYVR